ncbi:MAG: ABC transporter permease [Bacteroidales bacterium]|nr:ABC transporter permease [Bacteroidales bacterium]
MNKIGLIIRREYFTRVKKRSFIIMTFLGPLLIAAIYIIPILLALHADNEKRTIAVVDQSHWFERQFVSTENQTFIRLDDIDIDSTKKLVQEGFFDIALYIPETQLNIPSSAVVYSMKQVPMSVEDHIKEVMKNEIQVQKLLAAGVDPDILESIKTSINLSVIRMDEEGGEKETFTEVQFALGMILAVLIYVFIMLFGGQVMQGVTEEKSSRIVEVIVSSVKPFQLMMGKIIGVSLVALTQFMMWVLLTGAIYVSFSAAVGITHPEAISQGTVMAQQISNTNIMDNEAVQDVLNIVHSIDFGTIIVSFIVFFLLGYLLYATMFAAIGSLVENNTDSQQFTLPVTVPMLIAMFSAIYIVNNPDSSLAVWMSMIPFTSPIVMMVRIPFGIPIWQVVVSALILAGSFVGMTWVAAKIYRTGILMYGKKPTYKEIFKWLKY